MACVAIATTPIMGEKIRLFFIYEYRFLEREKKVDIIYLEPAFKMFLKYSILKMIKQIIKFEYSERDNAVL